MAGLILCCVFGNMCLKLALHFFRRKLEGARKTSQKYLHHLDPIVPKIPLLCSCSCWGKGLFSPGALKRNILLPISLPEFQQIADFFYVKTILYIYKRRTSSRVNDIKRRAGNHLRLVLCSSKTFDGKIFFLKKSLLSRTLARKRTRSGAYCLNYQQQGQMETRDLSTVLELMGLFQGWKLFLKNLLQLQIREAGKGEVQEVLGWVHGPRKTNLLLLIKCGQRSRGFMHQQVEVVFGGWLLLFRQPPES